MTQSTTYDIAQLNHFIVSRLQRYKNRFQQT